VGRILLLLGYTEATKRAHTEHLQIKLGSSFTLCKWFQIIAVLLFHSNSIKLSGLDPFYTMLQGFAKGLKP
jgi:hypothetical protein